MPSLQREQPAPTITKHGISGGTGFMATMANYREPALVVEERGRVDAGEPAVVFRAVGDWVYGTVNRVDAALRRIKAPPGGIVIIDLGDIGRVDTAGAFVLQRTAAQCAEGGSALQFVKARDEVRTLFNVVGEEKAADKKPHGRSLIDDLLARVGRGCLNFAGECYVLTRELGLVMIAFGRAVRHPARFRLKAMVANMERAGVNALPIICLLTFLIGAVVAQQGAAQLQKFGAEIFTINLIGILFLREVGILLTAIIIAGRSGSAFAAEIGTMKVNEEIDALYTLGLDPVDTLILPRVLALIIVLPLLTFVADIMGLLGGGVAVWLLLDMSPQLYTERLQDVVGVWNYATAFIKAPFMALVIAIIGCSSGLRVSGSAESVGRMTTGAVVKSIFAVIILDALFAIVFTVIGI